MTETTPGPISSAPSPSAPLAAQAPVAAVSSAPPADAAAPAAAAPTAAPQKAEPPAGFDAAFWDAEKGAPKYDDLSRELAALRTAKAEWDNARSAVPESPDKYEFKVSDDFKLPEGMQLNTDDPRLPEVRKLAHSAGFSQKQFEALVQMDAALKSSEVAQFNAAIAKEQEKLGPDKGKARIDAVVRGLTSSVGEADAKHLIPMLVSASQVQAFERLLGKIVNQGQATAGYQPGGQAETKKMSDEEWSKLSLTERFQAARTFSQKRSA